MLLGVAKVALANQQGRAHGLEAASQNESGCSLTLLDKTNWLLGPSGKD